MAAPDFWDDRDSAAEATAQLKKINRTLKPVATLDSELEDLEILCDIAPADPELARELQVRSAAFVSDVDDLELRLTLSGPHDANNAYLSIHAGAGGTESCDWVQMLLRMYSMYLENHRYQARILDSVLGDEAGLRKVTLHVTGDDAFGYLRGEAGVHRLVRISPFDSAKRRHTSFAAVEVLPELEESDEIEIKPDEIRVDTYRASGAGGQHVNKTSSAVRITHLETGIVVQCQNERSQHANRRTAMGMLAARLLILRERDQEAELARLYSDKGEIAFGSQIRSYVLHPYQMVKDHRTNFETGNTQAVLDGRLEGFIAEYLRASIGPGGR